jgi:flavin-dependent dehydrogenase
LEQHEVIIVGGGPAGSTCAWQLKRYGIGSLILDKADFPRPKLCAGWITQEVVEDLEMDIQSYPHRFLTFQHINIHFPLLGHKFKSTEHSIRRYEFDDWLLQRSGAEVRNHEVKKIRRDGEHYIIDDQYRCKYLIGAGGTRCPVYRNLFRQVNPRAKALQAVTLEEEFPFDYQDKECYLWFFENGLPGYSWYVPKQNGYINVGIGGLATKLKKRKDDIKNHWDYLVQKLQDRGMISNYAFNPKGYSYFIRDKVKVARIDNAFILGDAAGLATRDLCEGIGPAVKSALMAAESIANNAQYNLNLIEAYSSGNWIFRKLLDIRIHGWKGTSLK